MELTRRRLLASSGVATAFGLAGCSNVPFVGGGGGGVGTGYTDWIHVPDQFRSAQENLSFNATSPKGIHANRKSLFPSTYRNFRRRDAYDSIDVDFENVSMDLTISGRGGGGAVSVYTGSFDTATIIEELKDDAGQKYQSNGTKGNYQLYVPDTERDTVRNAYAISSSAIVQAQAVRNEDDVVEATEVVKTVVDVKGAQVTRYVDRSEPFRLLTSKLGGGTVVSGRTFEEVKEERANPDGGRFEGMVAKGRSISINGSTTKTKQVMVFGSATDVAVSDIREWIEMTDTGGGTWDDVDNVQVKPDGRAVSVTGKMDTFDIGA